MPHLRQPCAGQQPASVQENQPSGTLVGHLSTTDPDVDDVHTYTLVTGAGNADNAKFQISGNQLLTAATLDYETQTTYSIRVRSTDLFGSFIEKIFIISATNQNEAPTGLSLSPASVNENQPPGTLVGTFSATDQDTPDSYTYSLAPGPLGPDNGSFQISGGQLLTTEAFNRETKATYTIYVQAQDAGGPTFAKQLTITIGDLNDAPAPGGGPFTVAENSPAGTVVGTIAALNFEATPIFNLTVRVTDNGVPAMSGSATVTINLLNVAEAPVANDEGSSGSPYVETVGNTLLEVTATPALTIPKIVFNGNLFANDSDPDGPTVFTVSLESATPGAVVFDDNVVTGATAGTGIRVNGAVFDATPGGSFDTVSGGATAIGALGDGVGQSGLVLTNVEGDLSFGSLSIFADNGTGLSASSLTAYTGSSGLRITATGGTGVVNAAGGPAVDLSQTYLNIDLASLASTNSPSTGASLAAVSGSFAAGAGSSINNIASPGGTAFLVDNSHAVISYAGTISTNGGTGVSLTDNTGSTISFSGALTLSTGTNPAFTATGGGTVTATAPSSTLTTTTATALNMVGTTIGASGLTFRSISSTGSGSSGIVLSDTSTSNDLTVSDSGGACTSTATCSGNAIQNKTTAAISLINTQSVALSNLFIGNGSGNGITLAPTDAANVQLTVAGGWFQNIGGSALLADGTGTTRRTIHVSGATFRDNNRGVYLLGSGNADLTFQLTNNTFLRHALDPVQIVTATSSTNAMQVVGKVDQNMIGASSPDSGSRDLYGIAVDLSGDADSVLSITNNLVSNTESDGIFVQARLDDDGDTELGRLDLTLRGNDVNTPDGASSHGIRVESRNTTTVCLDVAGNSSAGTGGLEQLQTRQLNTSTFLMERLSDGDFASGELITDMPTVETFLAGQNDPGSTADATQESAATGYTEAADGICRKPAP